MINTTTQICHVCVWRGVKVSERTSNEISSRADNSLQKTAPRLSETDHMTATANISHQPHLLYTTELIYILMWHSDYIYIL